MCVRVVVLLAVLSVAATAWPPARAQAPRGGVAVYVDGLGSARHVVVRLYRLRAEAGEPQLARVERPAILRGTATVLFRGAPAGRLVAAAYVCTRAAECVNLPAPRAGCSGGRWDPPSAAPSAGVCAPLSHPDPDRVQTVRLRVPG